MKKGLSALLLASILALVVLTGCARGSDKMWDTHYTQKGYTHPQSQGEEGKSVAQRHLLGESSGQEVKEVAYPGAKYGSGTRAGPMFGGI